MVIEGTCTRMNGTTEEVDGTCDGKKNTPIKKLKIKENISIEPNIVHKYDLTITFKEINSDQNYNQDKNFSGVIGINEYKSDGSLYCSYDGEMVQGAEFVNGAYTYRYKQEGKFNKDVLVDWQDAEGDGWGVQLTDKTSTDPIEVETCTYINNKPVIYASMMFSNSKATSIDLSKTNTSKIQTFSGMFNRSAAKTINFKNVDTSNVVAMDAMFEGAAVESLDLSGFDTSNVTAFDYMFNLTKATEIIGLDRMDTGNVTNMSEMFRETKFTSIDLSNFNTSKVVDMSRIFRDSKMTKLDVSNFDTRNVKTMLQMFNRSAATEIIGLTNFDTTSVEIMEYMFNSAVVEELDLSSFDITNTSNIKNMFNGCKSKIGYAKDEETALKFNDSSVTKIPSTLVFTVKQ